jgi:hypothetical protein
VSLGPAEIDRWDPVDVRTVSAAATARAESAAAVSAALARLPAIPEWSGVAARAAGDAIELTRQTLDAHAEQARAIARAADRAADAIDRLKSRLRLLDEDARSADMKIDRVTGTVLPDTEFRGTTTQFDTEADPLATRLDEIVAEANEIDHELAGAISQADYRTAVPLSAASPVPPDDRNTWWQSLTQMAKAELLEHNPEDIGNCGGIPVADRSSANLRVLRHDLDRIDRVAADNGLSVAEVMAAPEQFGLNSTDVLRYTNAGLIKQSIAYNQSVSGAEVLLMVYKPVDFRGQGRAAIAIGNPDTADNTAVLVPGATNSVAAGWLSSNEIANLYTETRAATGAGRDVSVLAWMGYDAPDSIVDPRVTQTTLARKGGALLAADVNALKTTHRGSPSHVTVLGHSYGTTTVADAAAGYGMRADDIVLVGSPGTDMARTASDFHLPDGGHVYVGSAATDPVTNIAGMPRPVLPTDPIGLGADPAADGFGSIRFKAEVPGWTWQFGNDHDDYFESGSESLYGMTDVTSGHGRELQGHGMTAPHRDSVLGPLAARFGLPDWSVPLMDPELLRPATTGHHHVPPQVAGR